VTIIKIILFDFIVPQQIQSIFLSPLTISHFIKFKMLTLKSNSTLLLSFQKLSTMFYPKIILSLVMSSIFLLSCKDKKKIELEPEEYFSFYADGEYFNYPQIKGLGF